MIARRFASPEKVLRAGATLLLTAAGLAACGGTAVLPPPRPLIVSSGARLTADPERMKQIDEWVTNEDDNITNDPTFYVDAVPADQETYPWETLVLQGDTARYQYSRSNPDVLTSYNVYAHLHLMKKLGRLQPWLPEAANADGFELERAIVKRMADSWLLGRAEYDAQPQPLMDQLVYASEAGHLDAFILTARPNDFADAKATWVAQHPQGLQEYRDWFVKTFNQEPPGLRATAPSSGEANRERGR
jgi:hypothetical protein